MDNSHPISTPMVLGILDPKKDSFKRKKKNCKQIFDFNILYLNTIDALLYLT